MNEAQKKRRDKLAQEYSSGAPEPLYGDLIDAFESGYDACAKDAEVLVEALEMIIAEGEMGGSGTDADNAQEALTTWREGRGKEEK